MIAFGAVTRSTNLSLVHTLDVSQQITICIARTTTCETRRCAPTQMNTANVLVAMLAFREAFAAMRARESLFFVVNSANVCIEVTAFA